MKKDQYNTHHNSVTHRYSISANLIIYVHVQDNVKYRLPNVGQNCTQLSHLFLVCTSDIYGVLGIASSSYARSYM